jgi:PAS domain-containing protein
MRDPPSWEALAKEIAVLHAQRGKDLRAWSAACATGEEAYSLALAFARQLGLDPKDDWKVFATDLDDEALEFARAGRYEADQVSGLPEADLGKYFTREGKAWRVGKALRSRVVFGRNDLLSDPPLPSIDILACRNVLIYFGPEAKRLTLKRLSQAVDPGGILFLGSSEAMQEIAGFDRVGNTTFFRRKAISTPMSATDGSNAVADKGPANRRLSRRPLRAHRPPSKAHFDRSDFDAELQSRNEELQTVNEELQSLNNENSAMEAEMRGLATKAQQANEFLLLLLNTSRDALIACDSADRVVFWNDAATKRFRLSSMQAIGGGLFDMVPALAPVRSALRKAKPTASPSRVKLRRQGVEYLIDPLQAAVDPLEAASDRRSGGYLLRVRTIAS